MRKRVYIHSGTDGREVRRLCDQTIYIDIFIRFLKSYSETDVHMKKCVARTVRGCSVILGCLIGYSKLTLPVPESRVIAA